MPRRLPRTVITPSKSSYVCGLQVADGRRQLQLAIHVSVRLPGSRREDCDIAQGQRLLVGRDRDYRTKLKRRDLNETETKIPARLNLQVWDADHFSADDFLGMNAT